MKTNVTSELFRNSKLSSLILVKAELVGAKTVIGPGRSRTDARSELCTQGVESAHSGRSL